MISIKKPVSGEDFVNRKDLLNSLYTTYPTDNVALIGPRRIGKSSLAGEFFNTLETPNTIKVIFDVQENIGTPGKFAVRLLRLFLFAYLENTGNNDAYTIADMETDPSVLPILAGTLMSQRLQELSRFLMSYYPPTPDTERNILKRILNFIQDFSVEREVNTAIVLDEFHCILDLNKYKGFDNGNLLGFLRGVLSNQSRVWYLFTGSAVRIMYDIFGDKDAPFLGRVRIFNISGFNKDDTLQLVYKCIEKPISSEATDFLYKLTKGHPFYVVVIVGASESVAGPAKIIDRNDIENAFIQELSKGALDIHCRYYFETSLEKTGAFLKEVLRALSSGPLTLTELSRKVGRRTGSLTDTLVKLNHLDLIEKDKKKYRISDDILRCWLQNVYGYEAIQIDALKRKIRENYEEYFEKLTSEIGVYFESYLREMLSQFNNQFYNNSRLPKFEVVRGINVMDHSGEVFGRPSNIEIDALCTGTENWICEFKYKKKSVRKTDIDLLTRKRDFIEKKRKIKIHKMLYVAKSGFDRYAHESNAWCLTIGELNKLLAILNMRKVNEIEFKNSNGF